MTSHGHLPFKKPRSSEARTLTYSICSSPMLGLGFVALQEAWWAGLANLEKQSDLFQTAPKGPRTSIEGLCRVCRATFSDPVASSRSTSCYGRTPQGEPLDACDTRGLVSFANGCDTWFLSPHHASVLSVPVTALEPKTGLTGQLCPYSVRLCRARVPAESYGLAHTFPA